MAREEYDLQRELVHDKELRIHFDLTPPNSVKKVYDLLQKVGDIEFDYFDHDPYANIRNPVYIAGFLADISVIKSHLVESAVEMFKKYTDLKDCPWRNLDRFSRHFYFLHSKLNTRGEEEISFPNLEKTISLLSTEETITRIKDLMRRADKAGNDPADVLEFLQGIAIINPEHFYEVLDEVYQAESEIIASLSQSLYFRECKEADEKRNEKRKLEESLK